MSDPDDLTLCKDFCSCGNPDPWYEDHTPDCPMNLPMDILIEVEKMAPSLTLWEYNRYTSEGIECTSMMT